MDTHILRVVPGGGLNRGSLRTGNDIREDRRQGGGGASSLVYATGHIKDPVPLIEKRRGFRGGSRNSSRGGGRVQVHGNFHILTSKNKTKTTSDGGV